MDVRIETVGPRRVAYLRALGPYPQTFPALWKRFGATVGPSGLLGRGAAMSLMHDSLSTTPPDLIRGDAAVEVPADFTPTGELAVQEVPGGLFAVYEMRGPYAGLPKAWGELAGTWLSGSDYRLRDAPSVEVYANNPAQVAPEQLLTRLYLPVERR